MQYRVYDRQTLKYLDGGFVASYSIDDDYIVNNNSTLSIVKKNITTENSLSKVAVGDIIALIQDSGPFHKGVITAVDDTAMTISYKSDKELFNDTMLNLMRQEFLDDDVKYAGKFGIDLIVQVLKALFVNTTDIMKRLPVTFATSGDVLDSDGNPKMLWSWSNDGIKIVDWLVDLFEKYNVSLSWTIDFNIAQDDLELRNPVYVCTVSALTNSGGIIKDNVAMQTITYTTQELPDATVCIVISNEDKEILNMSSGKNLLDPRAADMGKYIKYQNDSTISSSFITSDSTDSNISGYIRIRQHTESSPNDYTYSQANGDELMRYIVAYNSNKKGIGYFTYTPDTTDNYSVTFNTDSFEMVGTNTKEDIYWFRVCYCNIAKEAQIEKGSTATEYDPYNIPSIFYLYEKDGNYGISTNSNLSDVKNAKRVLPVRTVVVSYDDTDTDADGTSQEDVALEKLVPSKFNQAIQIRISSDSKMFDFENSKFGDLYKIINEQGTIDSVFTGRKTTSDSKWVTLYFGLGRQNYTDIMQIRLRKDRYTEVYNAG